MTNQSDTALIKQRTANICLSVLYEFDMMSHCMYALHRTVTTSYTALFIGGQAPFTGLILDTTF